MLCNVELMSSVQWSESAIYRHISSPSCMSLPPKSSQSTRMSSLHSTAASSAELNHSALSDPLRPHALQPARLLCPWGFSRQEYWSGLSCTPPGDLPNPGIEPRSAALKPYSLPAEPLGKPKNTGVGSLFLLQGIFPTQELNQGLPRCRQILYQLNYQGSHSSSLLAIYLTHDSVYVSFLLSQLLTLPFILPPLCSQVHSLCSSIPALQIRQHWVAEYGRSVTFY